MIAVSCFGFSTKAAGVEVCEVHSDVERASGRFSIDIPGNTLAVTSSYFPLEAGETVTISAVYSPRSASVDFGLIAPDSLFYPFRAENGSFDKTIEVNQRGYYTLAVRNNSSFDISVSGFVTY
ncbi:hypothetical protein [uncultured Dysosmobacter sp.]|uniref:hypothetical protein n=1 Tax=uncultured Dysosmobacter sp. TaxID=2591384 RepID=UPI00262218C4|nr:hypothetical protein [uncultured Dysosmobacter sp.]